MRDPVKDATRVSLVELDRATSKNLARARERPLLVTNRHAPWIWIVSHDVWVRDRQYLQYIPDSHPLLRLRDVIDPQLARRASELAHWQASLSLGLPALIVCRALILQVLYSIPDLRALYDNIGYNMVFRRFVGVDLSMPLWGFADFERDLQALARCRDFVGLAEEMIALPARVGQDTEFSIAWQMLAAWQAGSALPAVALDGARMLDAPPGGASQQTGWAPVAGPGVAASRANWPMSAALRRARLNH